METLADRILRDGALNELDAVGWIIRLAKRLEALHAVGVAHGSVSPACVLVAATDRTSRAMMVDLRRTSDEIAYHSPERLSGEAVSPADDVWALAATLYAVLTGSPPFGASDDADVRAKIAAAAPAPLAVFDVGDDDLQKVLDEALQREPAKRTKSIAALRRELEAWHPDPGAKQLPPLEDQDEDDDDDDARTVMRAAIDPALLAKGAAAAKRAPAPKAGVPARPVAPAAPRPGAPAAPRPQAPAAARPAPAAPAAPRAAVKPTAASPSRPFGPAVKPSFEGLPAVDGLMEEDDDERTVMRQYPLPAAAFRPAGAPAPLRPEPAASASLPTPIAPKPFTPARKAPPIADDDSSDDGDDERTVMRAAPVPIGDDEDDDGAMTMMREASPLESAARLGAADRALRAPLPAAGLAPAPPPSNPGVAAPAPMPEPRPIAPIASAAGSEGRATPTTALSVDAFAAAPAVSPAPAPAAPLVGDLAATVAFPAPSAGPGPGFGAPPPAQNVAPPIAIPSPIAATAPSAVAPLPLAVEPIAPPRRKSVALVLLVAVLALVVAAMVTFLVLHARGA